MGAPSLLALLLITAGCASTEGLAPTTHPLQADALAASRSLGGAPTGTFPTATWWAAFGDPQLDALIAEGLAGHPSLEAADARLRQAVAQAGLAAAARRPTVAAGAQYSGLRIPPTLAPPPLGGDYKGIVLLTLNLRYTPDFWGGQRARHEAAIGQVRAAEIEAQAARLGLASNIARTYVALAQAWQVLDLADEEASRAQRVFALGRQRVRAGLDNQVQLRQSQVLVAAAAQQAQAAQLQIDSARHALAALVGKGPDRGATIGRPAVLAAAGPDIPSIVPSELLGQRADVVAARWRVEAASRGIAASKAEFYPTVNLAAMAGLAAGGLANLLSTDALLVQGGPALTLPILDGGRLRSSLARSNADYDLAVAAYNGSLLTGLREVADALDSARSLDVQIASVEAARDAARAALGLATSRYRAGLSTQLEVLAAQRPLLQLHQQLATLRAQRLLAVVDLDQALGGGLSLMPPPSSDSTFEAARR